MTGPGDGPVLIDIADEAPETVLAAFEARGWGDGLPLVLPTPERVEAMLAATAGDPDEVLAVLPPASGAVTRRVLAVNAVAAGCRPDAMAVLEAAVAALADPRTNLRSVVTADVALTVLVVVHGPAAGALGINAAGGALGPGPRANATVARAVRLLLLHAGGAPHGPDVPHLGRPDQFGACMAEHTAASPWGPYHLEAGVDAPSAVTVHCADGPRVVVDRDATEPETVLAKVAATVATLGSGIETVGGAEVMVVLCPRHAALAGDAGWSRRDLQCWLHEHARLPRRTLRRAYRRFGWPAWMQALDEDADVPVTDHPDRFRILVAGGDGHQSAVLAGWPLSATVTVPLPYEPRSARP